MIMMSDRSDDQRCHSIHSISCSCSAYKDVHAFTAAAATRGPINYVAALSEVCNTSDGRLPGLQAVMAAQSTAPGIGHCAVHVCSC